MRYLIASLLLTCCGASFEAQPILGCDLTVSFDAATVEAGRGAVERLNAATGCWVAEASDGVPVGIVSDLEVDGTHPCAGTYVTVVGEERAFYAIEGIDVSAATMAGGRCNQLEDVLVHEMIHAMLGTIDLHSERGVFAEYSGSGGNIDESTLETICSVIECPAFNPER